MDSNLVFFRVCRCIIFRILRIKDNGTNHNFSDLFEQEKVREVGIKTFTCKYYPYASPQMVYEWYLGWTGCDEWDSAYGVDRGETAKSLGIPGKTAAILATR